MLQKAKRGFTLVEILIVVIILGILAAIVIPQFSNASQEAKSSSLVSTLQTLRSQIMLYQLQHSQNLPDITSNWDALTGQTADPNGDANVKFGPYMQTAPKNPLNGEDTVVNAAPTLNADGTFAWTGTKVGFVYDYGTAGDGTGRIWGTDKNGTALHAE